MKSRRVIATVLIGLVLVVLGGPFLLAPLIPGSNLNCTRVEINIVTGHERSVRILWCVPVGEDVRETAISEALGSNAPPPKSWRLVTIRSRRIEWGTKVRRTGRFEGARYQVRHFEYLCSDLGFSPQERQEFARRIVTAWQHHERFRAADPVIEEMNELLERKGR
ncbi:MAG: hypothetical protein AAF581_10590 [Planctomycetota bacterium]